MTAEAASLGAELREGQQCCNGFDVVGGRPNGSADLAAILRDFLPPGRPQADAEAMIRDHCAEASFHPKTKEGERTRPRSRGTAVADCGAKRATRDGNEARYAADEPTQIWIATISGRHDLIVRSSGRRLRSLTTDGRN